MTTKQPDYLAYLLRLWRVNAAAGAWRASLEDPHTGRRLLFACPEAAFEFLRDQMGLASAGDPTGGGQHEGEA